MLSNSYKDIHLFRFDEKTGNVFILAGDDIQIVVCDSFLVKSL